MDNVYSATNLGIRGKIGTLFTLTFLGFFLFFFYSWCTSFDFVIWEASLYKVMLLEDGRLKNENLMRRVEGVLIYYIFH